MKYELAILPGTMLRINRKADKAAGQKSGANRRNASVCEMVLWRQPSIAAQILHLFDQPVNRPLAEGADYLEGFRFPSVTSAPLSYRDKKIVSQ
jgi:hypothetical protein